jgi:hypothetical protein
MKEENEEKIIKDILSRGSEFSAPADMPNLVLASWKQESATVKAYKPILPRWVLWAVVISMAAVIVSVLVNGTQAETPAVVASFLDSINGAFSGIGSSLSVYTLMAIVALCISMFAHAVVVNVKRRNLLVE